MNMKKFLRPSARVTDIIPLALLFSLLFTFGGALAGLLLLLPLRLIPDEVIDSFFHGSQAFFNMYLETIGVWVVILPAFLIPRGNRPMLKMLWYSKTGNNFKSFLTGLVLGFGANALCVGASILTGDIRFSFGSFNPLLLLVFFVAVFLQSGSEELIMRLYLYQKLRRRYRSPLVAIIVNSVFFMAMHLPNSGINIWAIIQITIVGLLFSIIVYYYGSLWCAITFHTAWNFTQNILFGLPNSGIVSQYSLFKLEAASARSGFFYNVGFGVEGSIGACLILIILCVIIFLKKRKSGEHTDLWSERI